MPEVANGAMLVMEEVVFPDPEDAKNWPKMLKKARKPARNGMGDL